ETIGRAVEGLGAIRGRKFVLLVTEGFIQDADQQPYRNLVAAAQRVNAAIYFVDPTGLEALTERASAEAARDIEFTPNKFASAEATAAAMRATRQVMNERVQRLPFLGVESVAEDTGGFVVRNTNDVAGGVARAARESRTYYLLGYALSPGKGLHRALE